jgi:hypothetical protein
MLIKTTIVLPLVLFIGPLTNSHGLRKLLTTLFNVYLLKNSTIFQVYHYLKSKFLTNTLIVPTITSFITRIDEENTNNYLLNFVKGLIYRTKKISLTGPIKSTRGSIFKK